MNQIVAALQDSIQRQGGGYLTASAFVAGVLRRAIMDGSLAESDPLPQTELAAALNVSRMPVREALRILVAEGLVEFVPNRGAVVAHLSPAEIAESFEIRFALESLALRKSVAVLTEAQLDHAAGRLDALEAATDTDRWLSLHREFHLSLYAGAQSHLLDLIAAQFQAADRYLRVELATMDNDEESRDEHRALLAACRRCDLAAALAIAEPHIVGAGEDLMAAFAARRGAK